MKTSHVKISSDYKSACLRTKIMRAGVGNRAPAITFFSGNCNVWQSMTIVWLYIPLVNRIKITKNTSSSVWPQVFRGASNEKLEEFCFNAAFTSYVLSYLTCLLKAKGIEKTMLKKPLNKCDFHRHSGSLYGDFQRTVISELLWYSHEMKPPST